MGVRKMGMKVLHIMTALYGEVIDYGFTGVHVCLIADGSKDFDFNKEKVYLCVPDSELREYFEIEETGLELRQNDRMCEIHYDTDFSKDFRNLDNTDDRGEEDE